MGVSSDSRLYLHRLVDQLNEQQISVASRALETIRLNSLAAILREIPGLDVPDHWPPRYPEVEPLVVSGESVSEQLIRERR